MACGDETGIKATAGVRHVLNENILGCLSRSIGSGSLTL